jgi:uncharacterized protein (DUF1778 family)
MKFPIHFLTFSFLWMPAARATAEDTVTDQVSIQVQATIFKVKEGTLPMDLLHQPVSGDEALFNRLAAEASNGTVEILSDQHFSLPPGKETSTRAHKEVAFPVEYFPIAGRPDLMPQAFEFHACGADSSVRLHLVGDKQGRLYPDSTAGELSITYGSEDDLELWPVSLPDEPEDGFLVLPVFKTSHASLPFQTGDSQHHLVSLTQLPEQSGGQKAEVILTFFRAAPAIPKALPLPPVIRLAPLRLHVLTFEIDARQGRELIREKRNQGDAVLLQSLLQNVVSGNVELANHSALLLETHGFSVPPMPYTDPFGPAPDPSKELPAVLRESAPSPAKGTGVREPGALVKGRPTAKTRAAWEFARPTEYSDDLYPQSFEYNTIGFDLEAAIVAPATTSGTMVTIHLRALQNPVLHSWPDASPARNAKVASPDISDLSLTTTLTLEAGQVSCLGAISLPENFSNNSATPPRILITMVKAIGNTNANPVSASSPAPELECEIISLTENEAAALLPMLDSPAQAQALLDTFTADGSGHSLAFALQPNPDAQKSAIHAVVRKQSPQKMVRTAAGHLLPIRWHYLESGTALKIPTKDGEPAPPFSFTHAFSPPARPSLETLTKAVKGTGMVTEPETYSTNYTNFPTTPGLHISAPERIKVPAGHPEEGRWQVTVVRRR